MTTVWLFEPRSHGRREEATRARNGPPLPGRLPSSHLPDSSLRNKRPDLSGRPPCKGVAIGDARRGRRPRGERALRVPPF